MHVVARRPFEMITLEAHRCRRCCCCALSTAWDWVHPSRINAGTSKSSSRT